MKLDVPAGKYVVAVSGGVDSMVLLDLLSQQPGVDLVVAHFNHGIRNDSRLDEQLVIKTAKKYGLEVEIGQGRLGANTSEDKARQARYAFLQSVKDKHSAMAIITAHHQDDLIETAFLNLLRGSGRRGLSSIANSSIKRPLLGIPKIALIDYAKANNINWREDITNSDTTLLRNYLRQKILPDLTDIDRKAIVKNLEKVAKTNLKLDQQIATLSHKIIKNEMIDRQKFNQLPQEIANESVMRWLRENDFRQFDNKMINRLTMAIKTGLPGTKHAVKPGLWLKISQKTPTLPLTLKKSPPPHLDAVRGRPEQRTEAYLTYAEGVAEVLTK